MTMPLAIRGYPLGLLVLSIVLVLAPGAAADPRNDDDPDAELLPRTDQIRLAFNRGEYDRAEAMVLRIIDATPARAEAWFWLGQIRMQMPRHAEAISAFLAAREFGRHSRIITEYAPYNIACLYALAGEPDRALAWLETAVLAGFDRISLLRNDPDLDALRDDPRFQQCVQLAERISLRRPVFRGRDLDSLRNEGPDLPDLRRPSERIDFWLGDWHVRDDTGETLGYATIAPRPGEPAVTETWTAADGTRGHATYVHDAHRRRWMYVWTDGYGHAMIAWSDRKMRGKGGPQRRVAVIPPEVAAYRAAVDAVLGAL